MENSKIGRSGLALPMLGAIAILLALHLLVGCATDGSTSSRVNFVDGLSPVTELTLNGTVKRKFVIDTGASNSSIKPADAALLGLTPAGSDQGVGSTGNSSVPLFLLDRLSIGGFEKGAVTVAAIDGPTFDDPTITGLLGVDMFENRIVHFDFARNRLHIIARPPNASGRWNRISSQWLRPWKVMIPIQVNGVAAMAFIDSGAQHSVANPALAAAANLPAASGQTGIAGISGATVDMQNTLAHTMSTGSWRWDEARIAVAPLPLFERLLGADVPQLMLGSDMLRGRSFVIDYSRNEVWLER